MALRSAQVQAQTADTSAIVSARSTYTSVRALAADGVLAVTDSTFSCAPDNQPAFTLVLERDSQGVIRRLTIRGASDDSASDIEYYYDARARLRFAFRSTRAVNGGAVELRRYFDETGVSIRELRRVVREPGYPVDAIPVVATLAELRTTFCDAPDAG